MLEDSPQVKTGRVFAVKLWLPKAPIFEHNVRTALTIYEAQPLAIFFRILNYYYEPHARQITA